MPNWTAEQQAAIEAQNHTILVSAAAGSGKTAVLIERIVTLLKKGYKLDRMLIVTFTKAAASEMRERLNRRLLKESRMNPDIMGQALDDLESCEISTIHAFCTRVLRGEFQAVGIDPMFRICEENDRQGLFEAAFCDAMNELLEDREHSEVRSLVSAFGQEKVRSIADDTYTFMMSMPDPFQWLKEKIDSVETKPYEEHPWYQVLCAEARRQIHGMGDLLRAQEALFHVEHAVELLRETWQADEEAYRVLLEKSNESNSAFYEALASFGFVKAVTCRGLTDEQKAWQKQYQELRKQMKDLIAKIAGYLFIHEERLDLEFSTMTSHLTGLYDLIKRVHELFMAYKQQKNVVDFADLEQLTCEILHQEHLKRQLQAAYDHIFVDECQDVSAIQDTILQAIHGEDSCLFMVGDVKQSIYRFRLADPTRFLHRMRTYSDEEDSRERRIFLQKNFRSCSPVLDATNRVFRHLMRRDVTELDYLQEDELIVGRETSSAEPIEVHVIDNEASDDEEKVTGLEAEAAVLIERIRALLNQTFDDNGSQKTYSYRDMVILLPKVAGVGGKLVELLTAQGIPVYFDGSDSYFDLPEIRTMKALLSIIDNPLQDVDLMAALKTVPFSMTDEELAQIRLSRTDRTVPFHEAFLACAAQDTPLGYQCRSAKETLENWRFQAENMRLSDFIWQVLRESGFYSACAALPKGELRQANLRLLCQRAAEYEANDGYTLSGFLQLVDQQQAAEDKRSAKTLGENENLVRIMTMHKGKGLEFPVVFCLQLGGGLHRAYTSEVNLHSGLGVSLPYINRRLNIRRRTMADDAFAVQRLLDEKAERARLLYVAMTRAREKLILIGCVPEKRRSSWTLPENDYRVYRARSMMDWVMQGILTDDPGALSTNDPQPVMPWRIRLWSKIGPLIVDNERTIHHMMENIQTMLQTASGDQWISWEHLQDQPPAMPLKTSVSSLAKKAAINSAIPLTDEDESFDDKRQEEPMIAPLRLSELPSRPAFMEEKCLTGAERGTLTHRALSLMPLDRLSETDSSALHETVMQETHAMVERGLLTSEELLALPMQAVERFFVSEIGQRILRSPEVRREWSFNLRMDDGVTLLQGVMDCVFLEGDHWILLDYKTDRIDDESAFVQRYQAQLNWYARALEKITRRPVAEMWLYALSTGKAYSVEKC
ncbi:MAG: helicase-exonuclease AddAB subunit AddA [Christensenellaceae bacterium]|nr:helicase-exonuclease AddAB subunit AddA [Christensenellaceae bacterium]